MTTEWFGQAGHLCAANYCRFHLHTHVNGYCVSTVGEYFPDEKREMERIGVGRFYETMVFNTNAAGGVDDWGHIDFEAYNKRDDANEGHMRMVRRWARKRRIA